MPRLHGSYDGICGGCCGDAFLELTGGIGETIEHKDVKENPDIVFDRVKNALSSGRQVTGSVPFKQTKVIRVRNPWGKIDWTGEWSDGSPEWKTIPENSVKLPNKNNGEFLISLEDFMTYFESTTVCSIYPDFDMDGRNNNLNHVLHIYGEWFKDTAAGFKNRLLNPRFTFDVTKKGARADGKVAIFIQMIQQQTVGQKEKFYIRCDVYRVVGNQNVQNVSELVLEEDPQEVYLYSGMYQSCYRYNLEPGRYLVIPGTREEKQERAFLLRVFSSAPLENVQEIPRKVELLTCKKEEFVDIMGKNCSLAYEKLLSGKFVMNVNAGGQISNRNSFATNPQYLITIPNTDKLLPLVMHVMQKKVEPQYALGFRIYKIAENQQPPLDIELLYDGSRLVKNTEGTTYKFVSTWDMDVKYLLPPGKYVALLHLNTPKEVKEFFILLKSTRPVDIKGFQTGTVGV
ncbi:hypothetical protein Btru_059398 [Bulinus truncatus]|nr:hypothetical protein Btru_059398 [Bulinus truncatus]